VSEEDLRTSLADAVLPAFVLVWREGWVDWLPAYLVGEFKGVLGTDDIASSTPEAEPGHSEPPPPPLEWYIECLGEDAARVTLAREPNSRPSLLDLDWSEFEDGPFPESEAPTRPTQRPSLPVGAFRDTDAYISHIRRAARRSRPE
jgi:hypothetical protein